MRWNGRWNGGSWTLAEVGLAWLFAVGVVVAGAGSRGVLAAAEAPVIATTTVSDTVYRADGSAAGGTVLVSWPAFAAASGANVQAGSTSLTLGSGGELSVALVPNAGSTPMGSYYTVVYHLNDGSVTHEYWVVPVSASGVKVSTIRSAVLPTSVAMQTVSKSYVDTAIAAASSGFPLDSSPYVLKAGDTMTGPLNLPGDPTAPQQAADKQYVDVQVAGAASGLGQKVSLFPQATQTVAQPTGTQLQVNNLNGVEDANQYASGAGNNGIANAAASADCANGCAIQAEQAYGGNGAASSTEAVAPTTWNNKTQVEDHRFGQQRETYLNPLSLVNPGENTGHSIDVVSTQRAEDVKTTTGSTEQFSRGLTINNEGLTGGSNEYPKAIQGTVPYFKTTFSALDMTGTYNTPGQHVLVPEQQNCYGVGDCLMGGLFMVSSGGLRDDADEGAHPFDLQIAEDARVFQGTCAGGCTPGSMTLQLNVSSAAGTQGEGRYLIDTAPGKVLSGGAIVGGTPNGGRQPSATFSGTNFPVSVFLETATTVPTQANSIHPGTVSVPIVTSGAPQGFATNTAALPSPSGVACISDTADSDGRPLNFETAAYTVIDASHLQLTLKRPHGNGATVAVGGLCGYGLEQTVDTSNGIRQVFPVIGSTSATQLLYAGASTALVGVQLGTSGYANVNLVLASVSRAGGVVSVTFNGGAPFDLNGLTVQINGVADPSYNGSFVVTTTGPGSFTYPDSGPDSTSSGGTASYLTGSYALYPMAEVTGVFNAQTKAVDGQFTLAANTVAWAAGDPIEEPHYYQQAISADTEFITQFMPRPARSQSAGIFYQGLNGNGLVGWQITNATPTSAYPGNAGTHAVPQSGMSVVGSWRNALEMEAGDDAAIHLHCNQHGCDRWNSTYDLFQMDTSAGVDRMSYNPAISQVTYYLRGTPYTFNSQSFTAGTINVNTLNAGTVHGAFQGSFSGNVAASSLPVFGAAGAAHAPGAVPDPGAIAGATRFLREDGTWANVPAYTGGGGTSSAVPSLAGEFLANLPERANLLGEHLLMEGTGAVAHDTSGHTNDAPITGATWEGTTDLNFGATGEFYQLPTAENASNTWMFAVYAPPFGAATAPLPPGYGAVTGGVFGANPSLLCGSDGTLTCFIATSLYGPKSHRLLAFNSDGTESAETLTAGVHIVTIVCGDGGSNPTHYFYDGAEVGGYVHQGNASCLQPAAGHYQIGGSTAYGGTWFTGKVAGDWEWSTRLSAGEVKAAAKMAADFVEAKGFGAWGRPVVRTTPALIAGIDSRTAGVGNPAGADWLSLTQIADPTFAKVNLAISGATIFDSCAMFESQYAPQIAQFGRETIVSIWGVVNDQGIPARTRADNLRCMVKKAKALGARVILATEISNSLQESVSKDGVDAIIRAEAYPVWGVDNLVDLASSAVLGADNAYTNTNCFPDGLHPGPNCEPLIAALESNAVNELIGSSQGNRNTTAAASYSEVAGDRFLDLTGTATQTVTLPDCTGYTLQRQVVNTGGNAATVNAANGQTLLGSGTVAAGTGARFQPVPGPLASGGCRWERE